MALTTRWSQIERLRGSSSPEAWQWFIDRYRGFVGTTVRRIIWSPDRATAATDEFWGYLFERGALEHLPRPTCFRAFLVSTLRNYARDWMRRNPRPQVRGGDPEDPGALLPEDLEVTLWARHLLNLALRRLDREQPRQALILRAFYGLPQDADAEPLAPRSATSIAGQLGCTPNSLYQLMHRARAGLRDHLLDEIRQTVGDRQALESEMEVMQAALSRMSPGVLAADVGPETP